MHAYYTHNLVDMLHTFSMANIGLTLLLISLLLSTLARGQGIAIQRNIVTATATGTRSYKNTIAAFSLCVEFQGQTAGAVQRKLASASNKLVAFLNAKKVEKLQTSGVSFYATYDYSSSPFRLTGYRGSNTVTFEVPVEQAGPIMDESVKNGATRVSGIRYKGTPAVKQAARNGAIADAAKVARMEATAIVVALGRRLGQAVNMKIKEQSTPYYFGGGGSGAPASQNVGGEQSVKAAVTVVFPVI